MRLWYVVKTFTLLCIPRDCQLLRTVEDEATPCSGMSDHCGILVRSSDRIIQSTPSCLHARVERAGWRLNTQDGESHCGVFLVCISAEQPARRLDSRRTACSLTEPTSESSQAPHDTARQLEAPAPAPSHGLDQDAHARPRKSLGEAPIPFRHVLYRT